MHLRLAPAPSRHAALSSPGDDSNARNAPAATILDTLTAEHRSAVMSRIRGKDTLPELQVRKLAHAMGYRFRLHRRDLPGTPDLVFPRLRKAILVHGCFWHHHPDPACRNAVMPKTRREWWQTKLSANAARDERNLASLKTEGWDVLVLWECEIRSGRFTRRLAGFLGSNTANKSAHHGRHDRRCDTVS